MTDSLELGSHVQHAVRGLGKIVHIDPAEEHVYFRDMEQVVPDDQVHRSRCDAWNLLEPIEAKRGWDMTDCRSGMMRRSFGLRHLRQGKPLA